MSFRRRRTAIIELPFKLVIVVLIMALTFSAGLGALSAFAERDDGLTWRHRVARCW